MESDSRRPETETSDWAQLLKPGYGLKRWLLFVVTGAVVAVFGLAVILRSWLSSDTFAPYAYWITLQFVPAWLRGLLLIVLGVWVTIVGIRRIRSIILSHLWPELPTPENRKLINTLMRRHQQRHGLRIVTIGGGTGMPQLLRGLRRYTDNITAVVTVADDGGSSGRLRRAMGMLPPGDFRNNIAALSESEGLMTRLFQYRFAEGDVTDAERASELAAHSFGNLFILTMAAVTGSFEAGIAESSNVLRVRGRVLPSTLEDVTLCAEVHRTQPDGSDEWLVVEGESQLPRAAGKVERVYLKPENPRAFPEVIRAILQADLIIAGPGSFFTSVLPNLLVPSVAAAIRAAQAPRLYVCNVATQLGETDHFTVADHMRKLQEHAGDAFPAVLANDHYDLSRQPSKQCDWVTLPAEGEATAFRLFTGDIADQHRPWRHDSTKLAAAIMDVFRQYQRERSQGIAEHPRAAPEEAPPADDVESRRSKPAVTGRNPDKGQNHLRDPIW